MGVSLQAIADAVGGAVVGDPALTVDRPAPLDTAGPGTLSFLANPKYASLLAETQATAVIVGPAVDEAPCALIQAENPDLAFAKALALLVPPPPRPDPGVHPSAVVHPSAHLDENVAVGPCAVVCENARIGAGTVLYGGVYVGAGSVIGRDCIFYPNAVVYHDVAIGDRVILQAGAVVGSDGFGFAWDGAQHVKIPQVGTVEIGADVEIGACATVDRARFGKTVIGAGTKLDNQIQIAHNVKIGAHCAMAAMVGISGSTEIGNGVLVGGQAGFAGHLTVGDGARFSAGAGVLKDVPPGAHYSSYPAVPHRDFLDQQRHLKRLGALRKQVKALEARLRALEDAAGETTGT